MKVAISLRGPTLEDLRSGNLRSEPRWERQALEACIYNSEITEIYTIGYEWPNGQKITSKYKGCLNRSSPKDCVLLLQDWNTSIINYHQFKAIVVNIFHGPWIEQKQEVLDAIRKNNGNIFFTMGFPILYAEELGPSKPLPGLPYSKRARTSLASSHLENFTDKDHIYLLPVPGIPESRYKDNFSNKNILWASRLVFVNQIESAFTFRWALNRLAKDPALNLRVLTGWESYEVKDYINEQVVFIKEDINDYFWGRELMRPYCHLRDRVQIFCSLDWKEVLEEYSNAKILATYGKHYGGPPLEASMHGVPFVGSGNFGALGDCPGYLTASSEAEVCSLLDRLMDDYPFYGQVANCYHSYAIQIYSFSAFNKNLNNILRSRGII